MIARDLLGHRPAIAQTKSFAYLVKVKDASGHEHGADGKFTSGGAGSTSHSEKPAAKPYPVRTLNRDVDLPEHLHEAVDDRPHAIFLLGGAGSGKGAVLSLYTGRVNKHGEETEPAHAGFSRERVIDPDELKRTNPIYDAKSPGGPRTSAELAKLPAAKIKALNDYIEQSSGGKWKNADDFAGDVITHPDASKGEGVYGGGIVHELSSHYAKKKLKDFIASPHKGSFVFDSIGSKKHAMAARDALRNGYRVTFHHVSTPMEIAQMRNAKRARTVDPGTLAGTHRKLHEALPMLRDFITDRHGRGQAIHHHVTENWTQDELDHARGAGWTPEGKVDEPG
jgi:hypothetical protein